jgi:hypothetical protein
VLKIQSEPVQCHLDVIGVRHGSVLSPLSQDLLKLWERFLALRCDQTFDPPQIGVGTGGSTLG